LLLGFSEYYSQVVSWNDPASGRLLANQRDYLKMKHATVIPMNVLILFWWTQPSLEWPWKRNPFKQKLEEWQTL